MAARIIKRYAGRALMGLGRISSRQTARNIRRCVHALRAISRQRPSHTLTALGIGTALAIGVGVVRHESALQAAFSEPRNSALTQTNTVQKPILGVSLDALRERFNKFASISEESGERYMAIEDFFKSLLPQGINANFTLDSEGQRFFNLADVNRDGKISFHEYALFATFLTQPEATFRIGFMLFDSDRDGRISLADFKKMLAAFRQPGMEFDNEKSELLQYFFGPSGEKTVTFDDFANFVHQLRREIWRQEFRHFDPNNTGKISYNDFCSILAAHMDHVPKHFETNLAKLPWLCTGKMTFDEFVEFNEFLTHLDQIRIATEIYTAAGGKISKGEFQNAVKVTTGLFISPREVDIVYAAYDANGDGHIDMDEFERCMKRAVHYDLVPSVEKQSSVERGLVK